MRRFTPWAAAPALGLIAGTAFAPLRIPGMFVLAVAGLFVLLKHETDSETRRTARLTLLFGLGLFGPSIWWMNAVSPAAWFALVLAQLFFFWVGGLALNIVLRLSWWPLWAPAVWTAIEIVRSLVPFRGFPWLRLAHTSLDTPMAAWTRMLGIPATTCLMAVIAALLAYVVVERRLWPIVIGALIVVPAFALPVGLAGEGTSFRVAAIQGNTPGPFLAWPRGEILDLHLAETGRLDESVDLIIWPENASDVDVRKDPGARYRVSSAAARAGAPILVGAILDGPTADTALNASFVVDAEGPEAQQYLKRYIVPWGEYVPFRQLLGPMVPRFDRDIPRDLLRGKEPGVIDAAGVIVGTAICWDIAHDRAIADSIDAGAQFIAVQTSNASFADFGRGIQPEQQWDISRLRAIETGRWVVVASTNGVSGIIDPSGEVIERLDSRVPATAIGQIDLATSKTPSSFLRIPTSAAIWFVALSGLGLGLKRYSKESS